MIDETADEAAERMERRWTPGPWAVSGIYCIKAVIDGSSYVISEAFGRVSERTRPNAEANARLIAAAPELYEALEDALKGWLATTSEPGLNLGEIEKKMKAALAKARGE